MEKKIEECRFFAETEKGYSFKVMIDSLTLSMQRTIFDIRKDKFFHRQSNEGERILYNIEFPRGRFGEYKCQKRIAFSFNLKHLQRMIRNVKKKDSLTLYIEKRNLDRLYISIRPIGSTMGFNSRTEDLYININRVKLKDLVSFDLPEYYIDEEGQQCKVYGFPKVILSGDFQKVKKIINIGKIVEIEMQKNNFISFRCSNGELYGTCMRFGELINHPECSSDEETDEETRGKDPVSSNEEETEEETEDDEENEQSEDEISDADDSNEVTDDQTDEIKGFFKANFDASMFNMLMKLPGLCTHMQFSSPKIEGYPLRIEMDATGLGPIVIYIKDVVQIAREQTERDKNMEEEQSIIKSVSRRNKK